MNSRVFQLSGPTIPELVDREQLMRRLWVDLTKVTPSNISLVGPRFSGKTVILHALLQRMQSEPTPFGTVILWDLAHLTPQSDEEFLRGFRDKLADGLTSLHGEYAKHLREVEDNFYGEIREIFELLRVDREMVLLLLDGFDTPLKQGRLTRNVWDQVRVLAELPSLRLLTASRRKLAELIRSDEIASSEFWNIFDTTLRIEVFDESEIDIVLRKVPQVTWSKGARSELVNWSGAFPRLILALINEVVRTQDTGEIDAECVNRAAADSIDGVSSVLERLWSDCPSSARELYRRLDSEGPGKLPATHRPDIAVLSERGFIRREGDTWRASCRWLKQYLEENTSDLDCIPRLFGSPDLHRKNLKSVLDGRLSHLQGLDLQLGRYLDMLLSDIPDHPEDCLRNVRYYWDRAIALIWDAEFGRERTIPPDYLDYWKTCGETLMNKWSGPFPVGNKGHQMGLLDLLTGTQRSNPRAKFVSKNTSTLLSAALGYGNFGTHSEFYDVDLDLAHVAIHTCIEIAGRLTSELPR